MRRQGWFAHAPRPDLILLDLDLTFDGRQLLAEISAEPALSAIPVVVLAVSRTEVEVLQGQGLEARAYVTKPVDVQQFIGAIESIEEFWLTIAVIPRDQPAT